MKKHLFLIASVFATVSLQAQVIVNVAADTGVKIKGSTLFYVDGQMKVADYSGVGNKKISNQGNVKITKNLVNQNTNTQGQEDGSNFVNEYYGTGKYGQLIVTGDESGDPDNSGKISSQVKFSEDFVYHPLAIPYTDLKAKELVEQIYPNNNNVESSFVGYRFEKSDKKYFDKNRIKNPLFTWVNNTEVGKDKLSNYLKHLSIDEDIKPTVYYAVNKGSALGAFDFSNITSIKGNPFKKKKPVRLVEYKIGKSLESNPVGEYYGSYIFDYSESLPHADWTNYKAQKPGVSAGTFGSNIFNLGNPYTSNIDLYKLIFPFKDKVKAVIQYENGRYRSQINEGSESGAYGGNSMSVPSETTGDEIRYTRPFQTFSIKMKEGFGNVELNFSDEVKTFKAGSSANVLYKKGGDNLPVVNQVGLDVMDTDGNLISKTYVVASDIYDAAKTGVGTEMYNPLLSDEVTAIYTIQEKEDGTIAESLLNEKTYINGVNADKYIAKPIHLVFQNGKGSYVFNARLNDNLKNNKNAFYFEDKAEGKIIKINEDFSYTVNVNGTETDRFLLYWAAVPSKEITEKVAEDSVDTTVVFKDADTYKVRFDKEMQVADVFVYSISGQLLNVAREVNTSQDYIIPINGATSVYLVKIVGNNGKVITKKIIK